MQPSLSLSHQRELYQQQRKAGADPREQADAETFQRTGKMPCLEECTRTVSKAFSICATDRSVPRSLSVFDGFMLRLDV